MSDTEIDRLRAIADAWAKPHREAAWEAARRFHRMGHKDAATAYDPDCPFCGGGDSVPDPDG